jgi:serine/threonine protein kinase
MNRQWWLDRVEPRIADAVEERLAAGGRDVGDVLVELCNEGVFVHARLQELMSDLESVITLSEGPVQDSLEVPLHLVSELGRGAMGFVHAARDSTLGRNVAVKKMDPKAVHNDVIQG